jgi:flavin reductase (DIM6/NTAB) family NADH-FMN oxidoreductase RutF
MKTIDPNTLDLRDLHQFLIGAVAPRPIAFVSTVDEEGNANLAPYSFFNVFSAKPPVFIFSSNRRGRDNTIKDTLNNVEATGEVVINMVSYDIVQQMSVCSIDYPEGVSEFKKSGLTPVASELVRPPRVKEAPVQFECKVQQVIKLAETGGAGNLIICELVMMHFSEHILGENGRINPHKIDLMGRMGQSYYVRASGEAIHAIHRSSRQIGVGYDQLPKSVRESIILTGNNLGQLAGISTIPDTEAVLELKTEPEIFEALKKEYPIQELHSIAQRYLEEENVGKAARIVWLGEYL